jgi:hypothetical protein
LSVIPEVGIGPDFKIFSLSVGVGRALNRHIALSAGYGEHLTGDLAFRRAFVVGVNHVFRPPK